MPKKKKEEQVVKVEKPSSLITSSMSKVIVKDGSKYKEATLKVSGIDLEEGFKAELIVDGFSYYASSKFKKGVNDV